MIKNSSYGIPPANWVPKDICSSIHSPKEFLAFKGDVVYDLLIETEWKVKHLLHITAFNPIERRVGFRPRIYDTEMETGSRELVHTCFILRDPDSPFPGGNEYNHVSNAKCGPLKDNSERACPIDILYESQKMECVSPEESVWSTKLLAELESIKKEVEPNNIFKCVVNLSGLCVASMLLFKVV